jgi:mRNA interferase RelE/StbE
MNEPIKTRVKLALKKLEQEPPQGDIKFFSEKEGYRLRVGGYRILFGIKNNNIIITDIGPRGQIYKRR